MVDCSLNRPTVPTDPHPFYTDQVLYFLPSSAKGRLPGPYVNGRHFVNAEHFLELGRAVLEGRQAAAQQWAQKGLDDSLAHSTLAGNFACTQPVLVFSPRAGPVLATLGALAAHLRLFQARALNDIGIETNLPGTAGPLRL